MTKLTPERIRDAAEVLRQVNVYTGGTADLENLSAWTVRGLRHIAMRVERELADAEAKRATRILQFAAELYGIAGGSVPFESITPLIRDWHIDVARKLIDRYPALAEAPATARLNDCTCLDHLDPTTTNYCALHGDPTNPGGDCK